MASMPMLSLLSNRPSKYLPPFDNTKQERKSPLKLPVVAQVGARAPHLSACYLLLRINHIFYPFQVNLVTMI